MVSLKKRGVIYSKVATLPNVIPEILRTLINLLLLFFGTSIMNLLKGKDNTPTTDIKGIQFL